MCAGCGHILLCLWSRAGAQRREVVMAQSWIKQSLVLLLGNRLGEEECPESAGNSPAEGGNKQGIENCNNCVENLCLRLASALG